MRWTRIVYIIPFCWLAVADPVDDIVRSDMAEQHVPGLALAVMRDGRIIRGAGYGLANVELNVPVSTRSVFKIGSVSKQFLAAAAMILVQDGRLSLDDRVQRFLPDAPETWQAITIRRLLSHTGGLVREGPAFDSLKIRPDIDIIRSAYPVPLDFPPGTKWQYSNLGFFTVAEIIARVSGEPWPDFLAERIFRRLHMDATRTTTAREIVPHRADGYVFRNGKLERAQEYLALRPSGALLSTVEDLALWDAALYTNSPLTGASREQMWTPVELPNSPSEYGLGWTLDRRGGRRCVHHGGSLPGFRAHFARFPEERLSFVVLTNGDGAHPDRTLFRIAAHWLSGVDVKN